MTYSSPQAPTAPAPASAPTTTVAPAPTDGSGYDGSDGEDYEDDSDASVEDTGDDSNLPYCDEVGGDYEPVSVTAQSQPQPQPITPAPEPTTPAPEPITTMEPEPTTLPTEPEPTTTAPDNNNGGDGEVHTGGVATFYEQNGSEGACGGYHDDTEYIGAMNYHRYGVVSGRTSFWIFAFVDSCVVGLRSL